MNQREHTRIQIPLAVELTHPSVGTRQTTARDISAGGIFVHLPDSPIRQGAKIKVRLLNLLDADNQPTPTVDMEVKRLAQDGLGCAFVNRTAEHLWHSALRLRNELEIGRDYFQVYQTIALLHADKGILLVLQNGKWRFTGSYLLVGQSALQTLSSFSQDTLGIEHVRQIAPIEVDSAPQISVPEAATLTLTYQGFVDAPTITLAKDSDYKDSRWVRKIRDIDEITLVSEEQRDCARELLRALDDDTDD